MIDPITRFRISAAFHEATKGEDTLNYIPPDCMDDECINCAFTYGKHRAMTDQCPGKLDDSGYGADWDETIFKLKEKS